MEKQQHTKKPHTDKVSNRVRVREFVTGILLVGDWKLAVISLRKKKKALAVLGHLYKGKTEIAIRIDIVWNWLDFMPEELKEAIENNDDIFITKFVIEDRLNNPDEWRKSRIKQFQPGIRIFENWTRKIRKNEKHVGRIFIAKGWIEDPSWFIEKR